jgi:hypothetical protein
VIGNPLAGFPVTTSGEGPNVSASIVTGGTLAGGHAVAFGVGVIRRGAYEIVPGLGDFTPAPEVSIAAGLDLGRALAVPAARVDVRWRSFGRDEWNGEDVYDAGGQLMLQTTITLEERPFGGFVLLRGNLKAEDRSLSQGGSEVGALTLRQGTGVLLRAAVRRALAGGARAGLALEWSRGSGSDYPGFDGDLVAFGPVADLPWGRDVRVDLRLSLHTGGFDGPPADVDVAGVSASAGLTWRP